MTPSDDRQAAADALGAALARYLRSTGGAVRLVVIDRHVTPRPGPTFGALRRRGSP